MIKNIKKIYMIDSELILNRLKEIKHCKNDTELGELLGVTQSAVSMCRKRNGMFWDEIIKICDKSELDYILYGIEENGSKNCNQDDKYTTDRMLDIIEQQQESIRILAEANRRHAESISGLIERLGMEKNEAQKI